MQLLIRVLVFGFVFLQCTLFFPSLLEQDLPPKELEEADLRPSLSLNTFLGITADETPSYQIKGFEYISMSQNQKQWVLNSKNAYFYLKKEIVHAETLEALLYADPKTKVQVFANHAKYKMNDKNLELFGDRWIKRRSL
jgi:hypothetical protein